MAKPKRGRVYQVLLVCTGNTCRSPMAEGILRSLLEGELAKQVVVRSAGTGAIDGLSPTSLAVKVTGEHGIDIGRHRSSPLTSRHVRDANLVLGMEPRHVDAARKLAVGASDQIHLITDHGADPSVTSNGVEDPIGGTVEEYADTFHRIRSHLLRWLPLIREAVERRQAVP